jgi:spermidine/putrescine transport system permease protein
VFAIGPDTTMTIQIASMVRLGLSPEVNALAVLFIVLTIVIAIAYELKRRSEKARQAIQAELAKRLDQAIATEAFGNQPATASA